MGITSLFDISHTYHFDTQVIYNQIIYSFHRSLDANNYWQGMQCHSPQQMESNPGPNLTLKN